MVDKKFLRSTKATFKSKVVKKNVKASVFTHLFSIEKYRRELYLCFHPRDGDVSDEDIKEYTLSSVFTNIQVNDLGILVRDTLLVLVEAQSTWTYNILPRMLEYLAESYNRYVIDTNQNIYGTKKITLPKTELYVLYTGSKIIKETSISLKNIFFDDDSPIDVRVNVITLNNSSKIMKEYIQFSKIVDKNDKKYGYTKESIIKTIDECIDKNILREYLTEHKKEVYNIMTYSIDHQKLATEMYKRALRAEAIEEGKKEGMQQGIQQGEINAFVKIYKQGLIKANEAAKMLNITTKAFLELAK